MSANSIYAENIVRFADSLRERGLNPGLNEVMDALRAIEVIGLESRQSFKTAMGAIFAKTEHEMNRYNQAFDEFFTSEQFQRAVHEEKAISIKEHRRMMLKSADELRFQGELMDIPESLIETYSRLPEEDKERIKDFLDKTSHGKNVGPKFKKVAENLLKGKLTRAHQNGAGENTEGADLLYKPISAMTPEEVPQAIRLINQLIRHINSKISREYRQSGRRGHLDMKATLHRSLHTAGVPCDLRFKRRRRRKQRLILLCDISASMFLFSSFALQFIGGLHHVADKSEVYIFSEGIERMSADNLESIEKFEERVKRSSLWNKGTNIAQALKYLLDDREVTAAGSVLLIFSDAKTLQTKYTGELLREWKRKAKKVIWMNPLPSSEWRSLPWLHGYRESVTMLDCSTLERLAQACSSSTNILV